MNTTPLKRKRKQLIEQLHNLGADMLRGSLIKRSRKCGKSNCHCAKGQGHESYYLSVSMPNRSPIMIYVSLQNKEMVKKALANYQAAQKLMEEISNINREILSQKKRL
jgi:hypothetical protein